MIAGVSISVIILGIVMILAFVGMIACAKKQQTNPNAQPLAIMLLIVVIICGGAVLYKTGMFGGDESKKLIENEMKFAEATAVILGRDIAATYPNSKVLIVTGPNFEKNTRTMKLIDGLKAGLGSAAQCEIDFPEPKVKDPNMPEDGFPIEEMMKAGDFDAILAKHPDCTMVVSVIGLPRDAEKMTVWQKPADERPKFALLSGDIHQYQNAIKSGAIVAAVTYCPGVKFSEDPAPEDPKAAFDLRYLLVTPKNVDELSQKYKLFQ
jgi:hypothetical protein